MFKRKLNSHYLAQEVKILASYLDYKVLYPTCCNDQHDLEQCAEKYFRKRTRLARVLKVTPSTIDHLVHACLMAGMVWSDTTDNSEQIWREHNEVLPRVESTNLPELIQLIWDYKLPYWKKYFEPSTRGVMTIIEGGSYHHLSSYCH